MKKIFSFCVIAMIAALLFGCSSDSGSDGPTPTDGDGELDAPADGDTDISGDADVDSSEADLDPEAEPEREQSLGERLWDDWSAKGIPIKSMLGVASHMKQDAGDDEDRNFEFACYKELGQAIVREHFRWNHVEPADDEFHFERVQTQVDMALANNVRLIPQVGYDVDWAKTGEGDSSLIPEEYGEFTRRVAERYCDVIKDYELWNEPDMTIFWEPEPNPYHYGLLVKQAYTNIKDVCPDARVSIGGLASYSNVDLFNRWWFLRALHDEHPDIGDYFDVVSLHPYTFLVSYPPENDEITGTFHAENQRAMVATARDILADIGKPDAPIWFTEVGWPSLKLTEEEVARFLTRSVLLAARDGIEAYLWYTFYDEEPEPGSIENWGNYFGLFGWPGDPQTPRRTKKNWLAFKALSEVAGDMRFARDLSELLDLPNDVHVFGFLGDEGRKVLAAWDGRERPDVIGDTHYAGGPDTSYDLELPLPENVRTVTVTDSEGTRLSREDYADTPSAKLLSLTLDVNVRYIEVE